MHTYFLSHGAPDQVLRDDATTRAWRALCSGRAEPRAFLVATAHWTTAEIAVESGDTPATIHDFAGFPRELHQRRYGAPGDPALAAEVVRRLSEAGLAAREVRRGFDHGVWVPLSLLRPTADIPVIPISVQPGRDAAHHHAVGRALRPLVAEGCVVIGSGGATHALGELAPRGAGQPAWVAEFSAWLTRVLERGELASALAWEHLAPHAHRNHPSVEHLLPLFVAWGAAGEGARGSLVHEGWDLGVISLAAFAFSADAGDRARSIASRPGPPRMGR